MRLASAGGRWSGLLATRPPGRSTGDLLRHLSGGPGRLADMTLARHGPSAPRALRTRLVGPRRTLAFRLPHEVGRGQGDRFGAAAAKRPDWRGRRSRSGRTGVGQGRGANGLWGQSDVRCRWERLRAYLGGFGRSPDASGPGSGFRAAAGRGYGASADD